MNEIRKSDLVKASAALSDTTSSFSMSTVARQFSVVTTTVTAVLNTLNTKINLPLLTYSHNDRGLPL